MSASERHSRKRSLPAGALILTLLLAAPVNGEDDCGVLLESVARFRGRITAVEPIGMQQDAVTPVDANAGYAIAIAVDDADTNAVLSSGQLLNLGIHSPSRVLGDKWSVGSRLDLELTTLSCDGTFRRFLELRRRSHAPQEFEGTLDVGRTYRARVATDSVTGLAIPLKLPFHHAGRIEWVDREALPSPEAGRAKTIVFEVLSRETQRVDPRGWRTSYRCSIASRTR
jgi:hypothetical protein